MNLALKEINTKRGTDETEYIKFNFSLASVSYKNSHLVSKCLLYYSFFNNKNKNPRKGVSQPRRTRSWSCLSSSSFPVLARGGQWKITTQDLIK